MLNTHASPDHAQSYTGSTTSPLGGRGGWNTECSFRLHFAKLTAGDGDERPHAERCLNRVMMGRPRIDYKSLFVAVHHVTGGRNGSERLGIAKHFPTL